MICFPTEMVLSTVFFFNSIISKSSECIRLWRAEHRSMACSSPRCWGRPGSYWECHTFLSQPGCQLLQNHGSILQLHWPWKVYDTQICSSALHYGFYFKGLYFFVWILGLQVPVLKVSLIDTFHMTNGQKWRSCVSKLEHALIMCFSFISEWLKLSCHKC